MLSYEQIDILTVRIERGLSEPCHVWKQHHGGWDE